jgi:thioredoxin 1
MSDYITHVNDENFEAEVLNSDQPVLVDFWAPWCGPCVALGPLLEKIAQSRAGTAKVVKVNVDENSMTAARMGIRSIPTLMVFQGGELKELVVGVRPRDEIEAAIDRAQPVAA